MSHASSESPVTGAYLSLDETPALAYHQGLVDGLPIHSPIIQLPRSLRGIFSEAYNGGLSIVLKGQTTLDIPCILSPDSVQCQVQIFDGGYPAPRTQMDLYTSLLLPFAAIVLLEGSSIDRSYRFNLVNKRPKVEAVKSTDSENERVIRGDAVSTSWKTWEIGVVFEQPSLCTVTSLPTTLMNIHSTTCSGTNSFASFEEIWQTERTKINRIVEPEVDCEYDSDEWSSDTDSESDEDDSDEKDLLLQPSTSHQTQVVEEEEEEEAEEATDFLAAAYAGLDEGDVTTTAEGDGEALELHSWSEVVDKKEEVEVEESEICLPIAADSQDAKSDSALETIPETEIISTSTVPTCCDDNEHEDDLEDVTPVQSPSLALEEVGVSE
ncbi:hypothetical protein L218DRAFT_991051, partial [Marasmius fiardii PR-910]